MKKILIIIFCFAAIAFGIDRKFVRPQFSTKGLVAHYKLWVAPMTATKVFDYALNGNTGTITDTDTPITLRPAYPGFEFDGVDDRIDIGKGATIQDLNDFTISVWVNSTQDAGTEYILTQYTGGVIGAGELRFFLDTADKPNFLVDTPAISMAGSALAENTWYHLAVVMVADDNVKLYMDGTEDTSDTSVGTNAPYFHATENVLIGATSTPDNFFTGKIDDVRIYNRALSAADILSIYSITKHRYQK